MSKNIIFGMVDDLSINLWDQAFTLGCIEFLKESNIKLLVNRKTEIGVFKKYKNVEILYLPKKGKIKNLLFLIKLISDFKKIDTIYCIGADMLDGSWCKIAKLLRIILISSKYISLRTKVVSFSFTKTQTPDYKTLLRSLAVHAHFYPRDMCSMKNIQKEFNIKNITLASDLSFLAKREEYIPEEIKLWIDTQKIKKNKIIMVCLGIRPSIKNIDIFIKNLADELNSWDNWSVCIVQHVFDKETSSICEKFKELLQKEKYLVSIQNVTIVRRITEEMSMLASCLMHCALWAIAVEKPVVVLDYFGKMSGLFADLGLEKYVCNNENNFITKILEVRDNLRTARREVSEWSKIAKKRALKVFTDSRST